MYQHLSHRDRIAIVTLREAGHSTSEIAAQLSVHRSTVLRELKRNGDFACYDPGLAHKLARDRRSVSKRQTRIVERDAAKEAVIREHLMHLHRSPPGAVRDADRTE